MAITTLSYHAFVYNELPANAIRLLEILEPEPSRFAFRVKTYQLNEAPDFNALSYVWGQSIEAHKLSCWNGHDAGDITVNANLFNALPFLKAASSRPIWIDAVCIDQGNTDEKAIVVPHMDKIYSKAAEVLIWLGPSSGDGDSDLAMDVLRWLRYPQERQILQQKLCTSQGALKPHQLAAIFAAMRGGVRIRESSREVESLGLPKLEHVLWSALPALFQREWFYRVWTFQEIMLASNAIVLCGDRTIPWKAFQELGDRLAETQLLWVGRPDGQRTFSPLRDLEHSHQGGEWFWHYLSGTRDRFCRFREDRIYGVLSLAAPSLRTKIPVDYCFDDPDHYIKVYRRAAIAFLENLEVDMLEPVLEAATLTGKPEKMPSWVPDWSQRKLSNPPPARFQAGPYYLNLKLWSLDSTDNNILLVRGQQVDVVEEVINEYSYHWPEGISGIDGPADRMLKWLNRCENLTTHTVASDEAAANALWKTLVSYSATRNQPNFPPDPIHGLAAHKKRLAECRDSKPLPQSALSPEDKQALGLFLDYVTVLWPGKVFFSTKGGTVGIADEGMAVGDSICMFFGAKKYFILGPLNDGTYSLKSVAYIHGMMEDVEAALRSRSGYKPIEERTKMFRIR